MKIKINGRNGIKENVYSWIKDKIDSFIEVLRGWSDQLNVRILEHRYETNLGNRPVKVLGRILNKSIERTKELNEYRTYKRIE